MSLRDELIQKAVKKSIVKNAIAKTEKRFEDQIYDMRHPNWREELKEFVESKPMNLADPQIQKAIIEIAETSESKEVAEVCKLVIADHLEQGDTEIDSPREVILTALECVETSQSYYEKKLARVLKHAEKYITTDQQLAEFRELIADEATDTRKETE